MVEEAGVTQQHWYTIVILDVVVAFVNMVLIFTHLPTMSKDFQIFEYCIIYYIIKIYYIIMNHIARNNHLSYFVPGENLVSKPTHEAQETTPQAW